MCVKVNDFHKKQKKITGGIIFYKNLYREYLIQVGAA